MEEFRVVEIYSTIAGEQVAMLCKFRSIFGRADHGWDQSGPRYPAEERSPLHFGVFHTMDLAFALAGVFLASSTW